MIVSSFFRVVAVVLFLHLTTTRAEMWMWGELAWQQTGAGMRVLHASNWNIPVEILFCTTRSSLTPIHEFHDQLNGLLR